MHTFTAQLDWNKKTDFQLQENRKVSKNHLITIDLKPDLAISAAKAFKGDETLHNPEDLLLSSLVSCHMMSFLYCCAKHHVEVIHYTDRAEAYLEVDADGSGRFIKAILSPTVTIKDESQLQLAYQLHKEAKKLCFIANSCQFEIIHYPMILV